MSEATRAERTLVVEKLDEVIQALRGEIDNLEKMIEDLEASKPPELPEDREWRLEQMTPSERQIHELMRMMMAKTISTTTAFLINNLADEPGKIKTSLRIRFPDGYEVSAPANSIPPIPERE